MPPSPFRLELPPSTHSVIGKREEQACPRSSAFALWGLIGEGMTANVLQSGSSQKRERKEENNRAPILWAKQS